MNNLMPFTDRQSLFGKAGRFALAALLFTFLSFAIFVLEYTVLNFGDSDLPPFQPDTLLEKAVDAVLFAVVITSGLLWIYVIALLSRVCKRRRA